MAVGVEMEVWDANPIQLGLHGGLTPDEPSEREFQLPVADGAPGQHGALFWPTFEQSAGSGDAK